VTAANADLRLYRRVLRQARPYWGHIGALLLLNLLSTPLALLTPVPLKIAVDSVIGSRPLPGFLSWLVPSTETWSPTTLLVLVVGLLITITLLSRLVELGRSLLRTYTGERLVLEFRALLFRHVQRLSIAYHDSRGTADSLYRIQYDAPAIQWIAIDGVIPYLSAALTVAGMIYITVRLDWQLALVALAVSPVLFVVSQIYRRRLRRHSRELKRIESSTVSVVQEVLGAVRVVKAFGQEEREERRFVRGSDQGMLARVRLAFTQASFDLVVGMTTAAGTAAVLFLGVMHVRAGSLTLGELLLIMAYLSQLFAPLKTLSNAAATLQSSLESAERAFSLLDESPDVPERPSARSLIRATGAVTFRHVSFGYDRDQRVLEDVSFEIAPGTSLGIEGTTGAGKTTLVSLLTRFFDPTEGQILLDGVDLRDYRLADLRNQFAIVLQEPVLFSSSIAENITYAVPGSTEHEVIAAAKAANAHEFIVRLPQGYEARVGERGQRLSGGERQRIALARAFLKRAPVLVLDEPTSSVDTTTEASIMEAMARLMRGRTTLMIAHRLSTLQQCDERLRIENGRVVEPVGRPPTGPRSVAVR
jgi:ATP-binding cassette subfamily B protein